MSREINGRPIVETPRGPVLTPCAPGSVLARLGDKWTILVVSMLGLVTQRPNAVRSNNARHSGHFTKDADLDAS